MLTVVEKVLFLQDVDVFQNTSTEDLAYIAAITEEVHYQAGSEIFRESEASDSMYLVIESDMTDDEAIERKYQKLVMEKGRWKIASDPIDFYSQRTPAEALRSLLEDRVLPSLAAVTGVSGTAAYGGARKK